ncbi:MAG: hypothetical protein ACLT0Y_05830 [Christensenellales bacterium]
MVWNPSQGAYHRQILGSILCDGLAGMCAICRKSSWAWMWKTALQKYTQMTGKSAFCRNKTEAKAADHVLLATDPDREGYQLAHCQGAGHRRKQRLPNRI